MDSPSFAERVAVLVPCYNEELTVGKVVRDFREQLPEATVYVFDNNSSDRTAEEAREAGAVVVREKRQGKGCVLQAMFAKVDADFYVLVDGDDTYPADRVHDMLEPLRNGDADMVVGTRLQTYGGKSFRPLHVFGNRMIAWAVNAVFGTKFQDVLTGYRTFTRSFVRHVPVVAQGFEIETELTLQALYRGQVLVERPVPYGERPEGSVSKLHTFRDGFRVGRMIIDMFKAYRPFAFFGTVAAAFALFGLACGSVPVVDYVQTGTVPHFPLAILAASLEVIAVVTMACGVILDSLKRHFRELGVLVIQADKTHASLSRVPDRRREPARAR